MKVAYHFKCSEINVMYDRYFYDLLFKKYLSLDYIDISSKILVGDLCISGNEVPKEILLAELVQINNNTWKKISPANIFSLISENVFIICFETIQKRMAETLDKLLLENEYYLGAFEIDNSVEIHWWYYGECIGPKFRLINKNLNIFIDNNEPETLEYANEFQEFFQSLYFNKVSFEFLNYRYSLLDDNHNYSDAKRVTQWKKSTDALFSTITDEIISKLTDTAPELSNKLWAITNAFDNAETGEQYAQAMMSCRRVFEYITDCLFPATDEIIDGHSLKKDKYKNRLIEFAVREFKSDTNIDIIVATTLTLFEEWKKLYELSNKGIHSETHKQECRRCIIRTVLLLDDIICIKKDLFKVNISSEKFFNGYFDSTQ